MELFKTGKTKEVYTLAESVYILKFKDTITGHASGEIDSGGNKVVGSMEGIGMATLKMSHYFFELLKKHNISTHYVSADLEKKEMIIRKAKLFGKGLEFVVRYKATGSFTRRFGLYCKEGDELPKIFEVTLKDDTHDDPPVTGEILAALKLLTPGQFSAIHSETIKICDLVKNDLAGRGLELIDIKIEFGMVDGVIVLIDEVSAGNMRVFKDEKKLDYLTLSGLF